jgi:hypothetical protein
MFNWSRPQIGMLTGYTAEELQRIGWEGVIHPDDHGKAAKLLAQEG